MSGRPDASPLFPKVEKFLDQSTKTLERINYLDPAPTQKQINATMASWEWTGYALTFAAICIGCYYWRLWSKEGKTKDGEK